MSPAGGREGGRRRLLWWGGAGASALVLLAAGAWLAWTAQQARADLLAARSALPGVREAVMTGDGSGTRRLDEVRRHARAADDRTHDPVWTAAGWVPWAGSPIATTQGMTRAVRTLADDGMPALVKAADTVHPAQLLSGGRLDVVSLRNAAPSLAAAAVTLDGQRLAVTRLEPSWLGPVASARGELLTELESLADASHAAAGAARLVPPMLGLNGPRRYFVAFQNPAEARASGGLLDAYAVVVADAGKVRIERIGANTQLPLLSEAAVAAVDAGVDDAFATRYADLGATSTWLQANVSPHFPDVARTWEAMWTASTGQPVDGTVALTPRALAAVLAATGPVTAPVVGTVDAAHVEQLILHDQYVLSEKGKLGDQRKGLMLGVGSATIDALLAGHVSPTKLLPGLRSTARDGYLLVHSRDDDEQVQLADAGITGAVDGTAGPYAQTVVLNAAGNKLDSWLKTSLDYRISSCSASSREVQVKVTLLNGAPAKGLPAYVTVRSDVPGYPTAPSQNRTELQVLLTQRATLRSATLDGEPMVLAPAEGELPAALPDHASATFLQAATVRERPSYWLDLELVPGTARTLVLDLTEPPSSADPLLPRQVMVVPPEIRTELRACPAAGSEK